MPIEDGEEHKYPAALTATTSTTSKRVSKRVFACIISCFLWPFSSCVSIVVWDFWRLFCGVVVLCVFFFVQDTDGRTRCLYWRARVCVCE